MQTIIDACAFISIAKSGVIEEVFSSASHDFWVGPLVQGEVKEPTTMAWMALLLGDGRLRSLDDSSIPASAFVRLHDKYRLGDGETECMVFALLGGQLVCTNDKRATTCCNRELGSGRVINTTDLLRDCVSAGRLTPVRALQAHNRMIAHGAFLPRLIEADFVR